MCAEVPIYTAVAAMGQQILYYDDFGDGNHAEFLWKKMVATINSDICKTHTAARLIQPQSVSWKKIMFTMQYQTNKWEWNDYQIVILPSLTGGCKIKVIGPNKGHTKEQIEKAIYQWANKKVQPNDYFQCNGLQKYIAA